MNKELFIAAMNAALRMHAAIDRLKKIGFDIGRGPVKSLCDDLDKTIEEIGSALNIKTTDGYSTVQWWMEGMMMDAPYSTIDSTGKKSTPKTPAELWELMVIDGEVKK